MAKTVYDNPDMGRLILRLSTGGLMLFHGFHKLVYGHDFIRYLLKTHGLPEQFVYGVPLGEVIAPIFIISGVWCRIAAVVESFTMLMSIYLFWGYKAFLQDQNGGLNSQVNLLFLFSSIAILFLGPGKYGARTIFKKQEQKCSPAFHEVRTR